MKLCFIPLLGHHSGQSFFPVWFVQPVPSSGTPKGTSASANELACTPYPRGDHISVCDLFPPLIPVIIQLARISALWAIQSAEIIAGVSGLSGVHCIRSSNIPVAPILWMGTPVSCSLLVVYDLHLPSPNFEVRKT